MAIFQVGIVKEDLCLTAFFMLIFTLATLNAIVLFFISFFVSGMNPLNWAIKFAINLTITGFANSYLGDLFKMSEATIRVSYQSLV